MNSSLGEPRLHRADIIGRKLIAVLQSQTTVKYDLEWVYTYYRLDSGVAFLLGLDELGSFLAEEPPPDCTSQDAPEFQPLIGRTIVDVLRQPPGSRSFHDSPYLVLENGYLVTDVLGYPIGCGYAGLHIYAPGEIDRLKLVDYFSPSDDA